MYDPEQLQLQLTLIQKQLHRQRSLKVKHDPYRRLAAIAPLCQRLADWETANPTAAGRASAQKACLALIAPIWMSLLRLAAEQLHGLSLEGIAATLASWQAESVEESDATEGAGYPICDVALAAREDNHDPRAIFTAFFRLQRSLHINDDMLFRQTTHLLELGVSFHRSSQGQSLQHA